MAKKLSKEQIFLNTINAPGYVPYQVLNGTITWNAPYQFSDGSPRPKCINTGCNNPVVCSKGNENSAPSERSLRTVCSHCHKASFGYKDKKGNITKLKEGVTSFKKTECENVDGHITGTPCTASGLVGGQLELDHIDGAHINNVQSNVQTVCKNCHSLKSMQSGDFRKLCKSHTSPSLQVPLPAPMPPSPLLNPLNPLNTFSLLFDCTV
jgi:hypothetical protein